METTTATPAQLIEKAYADWTNGLLPSPSATDLVTLVIPGIAWQLLDTVADKLYEWQCAGLDDSYQAIADFIFRTTIAEVLPTLTFPSAESEQ